MPNATQQKMTDHSIIIIGAGFAGLAAGIYAQMHGYRTQIFEMHKLPGGLCTAWKRNGYTIDGCVHWLVGSSPKSSLHRLWKEVGIAQGRRFIDLDEFSRYECADGRTITFYCNVDRLERHLLDFAPQDAAAIQEFTNGIRMFLNLDPPIAAGFSLKQFLHSLKFCAIMAGKWRKLRRWLNISAMEFCARFTQPDLRRAIQELWLSEFSMLFILFTFAWLHNRNAGYPLGGSLPMALAMAERYRKLGGIIHYNSRVEKILVENSRAVGMRLTDGSEHRAAKIISAADGHTTIFNMLNGKYTDETIRTPYEKWPIFPSLLFIGLGINRTFEETPGMVAGINFPLPQPVEIADAMRDRLAVHIRHHDPALAPAGKTSLVVMMPSRYEYWQNLAQDRATYMHHKDQAARTVIALLDRRFPGLAQQVEMIDVATPLTFERYTGNWQGCFEGWLLTPQNVFTIIHNMPQTLPGLKNFYMCGQWVEPGGGLPTAVMSGRRLIDKICKEDRKRFLPTRVATN